MGMGTLQTIRDAIPYDEMADFKTTIRGAVHEATRVCLVPWGRRKNFLIAMLPQVSVGGFTGQTPLITKYSAPVGLLGNRFALSRLDPEYHPIYQHLYAMEAQEIEGKGAPGIKGLLRGFFDVRSAGGPGALWFYSGPQNQLLPPDGYSLIAVQYKSLTYNLTSPFTNDTFNIPLPQPPTFNIVAPSESLRYVSVKAKPTGKNMVLQGATFQYYGSNAPVATPGAAALPMLHLAYTWHFCPLVPVTARTLVGCVNSQVFDPWPAGTQPTVGYRPSGFGIGSILYLNAEISESYWTVAGQSVVDVTYHMIFNPFGWNRIYRPATGQFETVYRPIQGVNVPPAPDPGGFNRFSPGWNINDYADLNTLFMIFG